jgi:NADH dehydrogenase FAD-containing subunit
MGESMCYRGHCLVCRYALGDCSANTEQPLPALAQAAEQQGRYLAWVLNYEVGWLVGCFNRLVGHTSTQLQSSDQVAKQARASDALLRLSA